MKIQLKSIGMQVLVTIFLAWGYVDIFIRKTENATIFWFIFAIIIYILFTILNIKTEKE